MGLNTGRIYLKGWCLAFWMLVMVFGNELVSSASTPEQRSKAAADFARYKADIEYIEKSYPTIDSVGWHLEKIADLHCVQGLAYIKEYLLKEIRKPAPSYPVLKGGLSGLKKIGDPERPQFLSLLGDEVKKSSSLQSTHKQELLVDIKNLKRRKIKFDHLFDLPERFSTYNRLMDFLKPVPKDCKDVLLEAICHVYAADSDYTILTDTYYNNLIYGSYLPIPSRELETARGFDSLVTLKSRHPVFIGKSGSGKSMVVRRMAQKIIENALPKDRSYSSLENSIILSTTPSLLTSINENEDVSVLSYFESVISLYRSYGRRIITYIDDCKSLKDSNLLTKMKPYVEMSDDWAPKLIFTCTQEEYEGIIKEHPTLSKNLAPIPVPELNLSQSKDVLNLYWRPLLEQQYHITIAEEAVDAALTHARTIYSDLPFPAGPVHLLQDSAIHVVRERGDARRYDPLALTRLGVEAFVASQQKIYDFLTLLTAGPFRPEVETIKKVLKINSSRSVPANLFTELYREHYRQNTLRAIPYREEEALQGLEILARIKGSHPVFIGEAGVGKTTVVQRIAQKIVEGSVPAHLAFSFLKNTVVFEITPEDMATIAETYDELALARAIGDFVRSLKVVQNILQQKVIVYIDECHTLSSAQWQALKIFLEDQEGPKFIFSTTAKEFEMLVGNDDALRRRLTPILVQEFDEEKTKRVLQEYWVPVLEQKYGVKIPENTVKAAIDRAPEVFPDIRRPDGPFKLLQAATVNMLRQPAGTDHHAVQTVLPSQLMAYIAGQSQIPFNPLRPVEFFFYVNQKILELKKEVVGQDWVIEQLARSFQEIYLSAGKEKSFASTMIMGPTGVGKTYIAEKVAKHLYGNPSRMLVIDCNLFNDKENIWNVVGAAAGYLSSDKQKGTLIEFLDGPGRLGGVIVFNEADKAHPHLWATLMEFFDKGEILGNDGRSRRLTKHLIVFTSNKGALEIFPRGKELRSWEVQTVLNYYRGVEGEKRLKELFVNNSDGTNQRVPPEIINRINHFILAAPLLHEDAQKIARLHVDRAIARIQEKYGIGFEVSDEVVRNLGLAQFSPEDGARQIATMISAHMDSLLLKAMAEVKAEPSDTIDVAMSIPEDDEVEVSRPMLILSNRHKPELGSPTMAIPMPANINRFLDPEINQRLALLESVVNRQVVGQEATVREIAKAIRSHYLGAKVSSPVSFLIVGRTGTGKTELAKALANAMFSPLASLGDDRVMEGQLNDKIEIIDMSGVSDLAMANNIFGSPKGYIGSDEDALLESALKKLPNGGVIVFDELSNVGGGNPEKKNSILKRFYEILEEGRWVSPRGPHYNLSNYIIVATGNDGEQLFLDGSSDDMLESNWKKYNSREKVSSLLQERGFPEALLGRFSGVFLAKPLMGQERAAIAKKLFYAVLKDKIEGLGLNVQVSPDFFHTLQAAFFHHKQGARSIREFVRTQVVDAILEVTAGVGSRGVQLRGSSIHLDLRDNVPELPFVPHNFKREVRFSLEFIPHPRLSQQAVKVERILTELAGQKEVVSKETALLTAYHETGHALTNRAESSGREVDFITILPGADFGGYTRYVFVETSQPLDLHGVLNTIATLVAGRVAERLATGKITAGWSDDLEKARKQCMDAVNTLGLVSGLEFQGEDSEQAPQAAEELFNMGLLYAKYFLIKNWDTEQAIVDRLMEKGSITGEEFRAIVAAHNCPDREGTCVQPPYPTVQVTTSDNPRKIYRLSKKLIAMIERANPSLAAMITEDLKELEKKEKGSRKRGRD